MKSALGFILTITLLVGLIASASDVKSDNANLQKQIVGTWKSSDVWRGNQVGSVTFHPDGRFERPVNGFMMWPSHGYWRGSKARDGKTGVTLMYEKGRGPGDSYDYFTITSFTEQEMVVTNTANKFGFTFTR